jgi:hypothetical protein
LGFFEAVKDCFVEIGGRLKIQGKGSKISQ